MKMIPLLTSPFLLSLLLASLSVAHAKEEEEGLNFALIADATVPVSAVHTVFEQPQCGYNSVSDAVFDEERRCHSEALQLCVELGPDCGGYVIEPTSRKTIGGRGGVEEENGIRIKVFKAGGADTLYTLLDAVVYEKRPSVSSSVSNPLSLSSSSSGIPITDFDELLQWLDVEEVDAMIERALMTNEEILKKEEEMLLLASGEEERWADVASPEALKRKSQELAELKHAVIDQAVIDAIAKSFEYKKPYKPIHTPGQKLPDLKVVINCTEDTFEEKKIIPGFEVPGRKAVYEKGSCTEKQFDKGFECSCTEKIFTPKTCTEAVYIPGTPKEFTPAVWEPLIYVKGTCSVREVNKLVPKWAYHLYEERDD